MHQKDLFSMADEEYAVFQRKLVPTVSPNCVIGIRVPTLRKYAKKFSETEECSVFLKTLPHEYYDENMLHSILISGVREYDKCILLVENFLPFIDNWAVCDSLKPKVFKNHKSELQKKIKIWISSEETYIIRFGVEMLMTFFLDEDFSDELNQLPLSVKSDEYYVKMMVAWYYATALAKRWGETLPILEKNLLPFWTHNKTIQKALESFRISDEQKQYLKTLRRADNE